MSKPYFNPKVLPGISRTGKLPEMNTPKVIYHNPLRESVGRLEEQSLEALGALTQLNQLVSELVEINHMESKKMDQLAKVQDVLLVEQHEAKKDRQTQFELMEKSQSIALDQQQETKSHLQILLEKVEQSSDQLAKVQGVLLEGQHEAKKDLQTQFELLKKSQTTVQDQQQETKSHLQMLLEKVEQSSNQLAKVQDVLLEGQHEAKKDRQTQFELMEKSQSTVQDQQQETKNHLQMLLEKVQKGSDQVQGLKDAFQSEALGDRLTAIATNIQALIGKQDEETATVLEAAGLQNLLLEEIARKQAEFEKGQTTGFRRILEKLNLIKSENDKSHDTQLENQKILVNSLYKLVNEQKVIGEAKELTLE